MAEVKIAGQCRHPECRQRGDEFAYPDGETVWYCEEHARRAGFCVGCGGFWGGVESFEFSRYPGYCEECSWEFDRMAAWSDEPDDDWGYDPWEHWD